MIDEFTRRNENAMCTHLQASKAFGKIFTQLDDHVAFGHFMFPKLLTSKTLFL